MSEVSRKKTGAYYTPEDVVRILVGWAVRSSDDRLLDPSCGDGRFLCLHPCCVGVEQDAVAVERARSFAPESRIYKDDFFNWAASTQERFDCAAGNPPFIRYQTWGAARGRGLNFCASKGVIFNGLTSSWAPFFVAAASLLRHGGRLAFVVPSEIGHAPYASPLLEYLRTHFARITVAAIRKKFFPKLSDCAPRKQCGGVFRPLFYILRCEMEGYCPRTAFVRRTWRTDVGPTSPCCSFVSPEKSFTGTCETVPRFRRGISDASNLQMPQQNPLVFRSGRESP